MTDLLAELKEHARDFPSLLHGPLCGKAAAEIRRLRKQNKKLRDALAPFACLGRNELRPGDFNRARRAVREEETP